MRNKLSYLRFAVPLLGICFLLTLQVVAQEADDKDEIYYFKEGKAALESNHFDEAVWNFKKADSLRDNHPVIMQYLASACSQAGKEDCTIRYLKKLGLINADLSILQDSVFSRWQQNLRFQKVQSFYERMNEKITSSDTAFVIPEKDLHPESIVYDPQTKTFFASSIHKRKVVQRKADGSFAPLITDGLLAVSGMKVDESDNSLWITTSATIQMQGFEKSMEGQSFVAKLNLETGEIIDKYEVEDDKGHYFGDLAIAPDGTIYTTDSIYPAIYVINEDKKSMELLKYFEDLRSIQGITFNPSEEVFYFSDYVKGIFRFDVGTGQVTKIHPLADFSLKGIDGLYYHKKSLIAIQNGVYPIRITRIYLDESGTHINRFEYLEKNNPALDEPTLGTFVDDTFYYVANSPWGKYNRQGEMLPIDELEQTLILKIPLKE